MKTVLQLNCMITEITVKNIKLSQNSQGQLSTLVFALPYSMFLSIKIQIYGCEELQSDRLQVSAVAETFSTYKECTE